ncbi:MAG: hypothetical protein K2X87_31900 [Gemmataceae bacterium]|nr:hypothetical protein [Gemmataceae bacterium]
MRFLSCAVALATLAVSADTASACRLFRSRSAPMYYCPPIYHCPPHDGMCKVVILVPANARVSVGGAPLGQTGEMRTDYVPWYPGAIQVCVEVKAEYPDSPKSLLLKVAQKQACFTAPGQTVVVDLRPDADKKGVITSQSQP